MEIKTTELALLHGASSLLVWMIWRWIILLFLCVHRITARPLWGSTSPLERREQQPRSHCLWPTTPTECGSPWHTSSTFHSATSPPFNHIQIKQAAVCTALLTNHPALLHHYEFMILKKDEYNAFNFDLWSQGYCISLNSVYCHFISS